MCIIALTQKNTSNNNVIILTYGLIFNQGLLVVFALKYGVGGLRKIDIVCYCLFFLTLFAYIMSSDSKLVLYLSILTDFVAFIPVIVKNWQDPLSDSVVYFLVEGILAPLFSILSSTSFDLISVAFPLYLLVVNFVALVPLILGDKVFGVTQFLHNKTSDSL